MLMAPFFLCCVIYVSQSQWSIPSKFSGCQTRVLRRILRKLTWSLSSSTILVSWTPSELHIYLSLPLNSSMFTCLGPIDRNPSPTAAEKFKQISTCYDLIKTSDLRRQWNYDQSLNNNTRYLATFQSSLVSVLLRVFHSFSLLPSSLHLMAYCFL